MPAWPADLPSLTRIGGASVVPVSNAMPIDTEAGEPLTRRRFTGEMYDFRVTLTLTKSQLQAFDNFFRIDLADGTLRFLHDHPVSGNSAEWIFTAVPPYTPLGNNMWRVEIALRSMPT